MNIIEAIKLNRPFYRRNHPDTQRYEAYTFDFNFCGNLRVCDVMADDWEVEEEKRELSWNEILDALYNGSNIPIPRSIPLDLIMLERVKRLLGFGGDKS